jgi:hypothetical protein
MEQNLIELRKFVSTQFTSLTSELPDLKRRGLTLFLGKYYGHPNSSILMLGLNPGMDENLPEDYSLKKENLLLGDPQENHAKSIVYWRNARRCFATTDNLQMLMSYATYTFISPFRTPNWSNLSQTTREGIEKYSKPILQRIVLDIKPSIVITSGKITSILFENFLELPFSEDLDSRGRHKRASWVEKRSNKTELRLLQIPHFSRFNSIEGLGKCGKWIDSRISLIKP